jgi:hypothetical protein
VKQILKILVLAALLGLYWFYGGFASPKERGMFRLFSTIDALFVFGAIIALWAGAEPIGVLHPVSLRGIFTVLGILAITGGLRCDGGNQSGPHPHPTMAI